MGNRFSKPVAFNRTNEEDQIILNHTQGRNFSGYVKELIMADIQEGKKISSQNRPFTDVSDGGRNVIRSSGGGIKIVIGQK